jgi:hypothetical protein
VGDDPLRFLEKKLLLLDNQLIKSVDRALHL